jgi:uncharacterized protein (TIGR00730 family)
MGEWMTDTELRRSGKGRKPDKNIPAASERLLTPDAIVREVRGILSETDPGLATRLHRDLLLNALKCRRDDLDILDLKVLNRSMAEFRYAARMFKPYRRRRKVSIFGSARTPKDDPYYELAVDFARRLAEDGFMVITGAADGIMKAGNVGAGAEASFGVNILLPFEQSANEVIVDDAKLVTFKYFFTRKLFFLMEAHAIALFPGGFGTLDECFETLTLLQTGKAPPMPLLLMELPGDDYWESYDRFVRDQLLERNLISEEDLSLYRIVRSPEDGVRWVKRFYSTYHSLRQVGSRLVLRLERDLSDEDVATLAAEFEDIVRTGTVEKTGALEAERNEPELWDLPRVAFAYTKQKPVRLTALIHRINELGGNERAP